jgi:hypothetical protein
MDALTGFVSAVGVLALTLLSAAALGRFLVWRDGLRSGSVGARRRATEVAGRRS